jgi:uncharacterized protein YacL (UPF0231 family)
MPKSSKPKKKYQPKAKGRLPINIRFGAEAELRLQLVPHELLDNFRHGIATEPDWHAITARLNLGHTLAHWYFNEEEAQATMARALASIKSVWERHGSSGRWGTTGEEYHAIADGLNLTDEMQLNCTRRQLDEAMVYVYKVAAVASRKQAIGEMAR